MYLLLPPSCSRFFSCLIKWLSPYITSSNIWISSYPFMNIGHLMQWNARNPRDTYLLMLNIVSAARVFGEWIHNNRVHYHHHLHNHLHHNLHHNHYHYLWDLSHSPILLSSHLPKPIAWSTKTRVCPTTWPWTICTSGAHHSVLQALWSTKALLSNQTSTNTQCRLLCSTPTRTPTTITT